MLNLLQRAFSKISSQRAFCANEGEHVRSYAIAFTRLHTCALENIQLVETQRGVVLLLFPEKALRTPAKAQLFFPSHFP
jgi:hypothetical protein